MSEHQHKSVQISVVLPVRNGGAYIGAAIESILAQTFNDFELLIIDDASTDNTPSISARFQDADRRVRVVKNPGTGLVAALNYGITASAAPLIARMDADDIAVPDRLARQFGFLQANPDIDVVGSQVSFINERGVLTGKTTKLPESPEAVSKTLVKHCCIRHPTVLMRREAFEKVGGYRAQFIAAEDLDLWLRLAEHGKLANLPHALLFYRLHARQVSQEKLWTQRLSRNLAMISAQERRANKDDPINSYACFSLRGGKHECLALGCPATLCETFHAFRAAEALLSGASNKVTEDDARLLIDYVSHYSIGDGRSNAVRALIALSREAIRRGAPVMFARAFSMALRVHPGRTLTLISKNYSGR